MSDSFVFYRSFYDTAQMVEDERDRLELYEGLMFYGLTGQKPALKYPLNAILEQMTASVKSAADRYAAAKENGEKGGRPSKRDFIPPDEWQGYLKDHSQQETADYFGISVRTLQRWISAQTPKGDKTGQNLNNNVNVNDNENLNVNANSNSNYQNNNNKNKESRKPVRAGSDPQILPCQPGYEFVNKGILYRFNDKQEVERIGPV